MLCSPFLKNAGGSRLTSRFCVSLVAQRPYECNCDYDGEVVTGARNNLLFLASASLHGLSPSTSSFLSPSNSPSPSPSPCASPSPSHKPTCLHVCMLLPPKHLVIRTSRKICMPSRNRKLGGTPRGHIYVIAPRFKHNCSGADGPTLFRKKVT